MKQSDFNKYVGKKLREYRKAIGFNQSDTANLLDMSRTQICNVEIGKHSTTLFEIYRMAYLYGKEIQDVFPTYDEFKPTYVHLTPPQNQ